MTGLVGQRQRQRQRQRPRPRPRPRRFAPLRAIRVAALLVLVLAGAGGAQGRHHEESAATRIHRLVSEWRITEAAKELHALSPSRQKDIDLQLAAAELRFNQGDYEGSARQIREVLAATKMSPGEAAEWRGQAELAAATAEVTRGFEEQPSPAGHFIIRYAPGKDAILVPYAGEALDRAWAALATDFAQHGDGEGGDKEGDGDKESDSDDPARPAEPVRVEIYSDVADLARVSTLTLKEIETSGTIALCKWNRLMIVSPRALVRGYPWLDTLTHEYTHFIISRVSRNTVPIWLHEGLAKFEERRWRGPPGGGLTPTMEHLLSAALQKKRFITFEQMYPSMAKLPSQEDTALAFAEVYTVVEYLHGKAGWPGLRKLIGEMAAGNGDARAVATTLGVSFEEFDRSWKGWLRGRKLRGRGGMVAPQLQFRKGPAGQRNRPAVDEDDDSGDIADPRAKNFARLGGMLRARHRLLPAAVEYEKAQALVGTTNPAVANKLARTYLELGEVDKAIAAAEPARELYPDLAAPNVTLGGAWLRKGDMARAATYLEAAIRTSPFDPAVHCGLAQAYKKLGNPLLPREVSACQALGSN